ncbi:MAG: SpoIIE family protein phosphatase [Planctomycetes bacterium]|nr:SpoIIE family protein phosphatase [Planctomycetota bacterium]
MLRDLIDVTVLEDFLCGLARAAGLRASVYDARGELIGASPRGSSGASAAPLPKKLSPHLELVDLLPAREPPAGVAFVEHEGLWTIVVPVHVSKRVAGFVGIGAFRDTDTDVSAVTQESRGMIEKLPVLQRVGDARPVEIAPWMSRMLADWCLSVVRLDASAEEVSLLGDIGELLSEEKDLQTTLDHIVMETARVMGVQYCSLRLFNPKTGELTVRAGYNVRETHGVEDTFLRSRNPIDDAALSGRLVYVEDATRDPRVRFAQEARRLGIVSGLAAGMIYLGEPIGVLRIYAGRSRRFQTRHRNLLRAVASQAAIAVVNARLLDERLRSAATERQLATAGQVQARMVRTPPPEHHRLESALVFEPSSHVGGDFCDIFTLRDRHLAAVVGDVTGHGVPAALLMASARGALRAGARSCRTAAELVSLLNEHVCRETTSSEFVTLLLIAVDSAARGLQYVNAGHEPLLLLRKGEITQTEQADLVLGIKPGERYTEHALELQPGDFVLLYTDGVVEAMDFEGETFGRERLFEALRQYGTQKPDQALRNIRWDVRRFVGLAEQSDDLTMVGLRVRG